MGKRYELFVTTHGITAFSEGTAARRTVPFREPIERKHENGCTYIYEKCDEKSVEVFFKRLDRTFAIKRGKRLKELRESKIGTLKQVEQVTGILPQNLCKLERGDRDIRNASGDMIYRLAKAYGVTMEELVE